MFAYWEPRRRSRWNVGGRRTMWRMSNAQALIFIAVVVIMVALRLLA